MTHTLSLSAVGRLVSILATISSRDDEREFDAKLHSVITGLNLRKVNVTLAEILEGRLPSNAAALYQEIEEMKLRTESDWADESESTKPEISLDENMSISEPARYGYEDTEGNFIAKPLLRLVPFYCSDAASAAAFKTALTCNLKATITEVDGPFFSEYVTELLHAEKSQKSAYRSHRLALSLVGASLLAAQRGWTNPAFTVVV